MATAEITQEQIDAYAKRIQFEKYFAELKQAKRDLNDICWWILTMDGDDVQTLITLKERAADILRQQIP